MAPTTLHSYVAMIMMLTLGFVSGVGHSFWSTYADSGFLYRVAASCAIGLLEGLFFCGAAIMVYDLIEAPEFEEPVRKWYKDQTVKMRSN